MLTLVLSCDVEGCANRWQITENSDDGREAGVYADENGAVPRGAALWVNPAYIVLDGWAWQDRGEDQSMSLRCPDHAGAVNG